MVNKEYWNQILSQVKKIAENYSLTELSEKISLTAQEMQNFDIKALFVGHFSAGKSALLNGLLERPDFLAEDQLPQTAVAAELHWSEQETVRYFLENGTVCEGNMQSKTFPEHVAHVEYGLNTSALKELSDFTLVDTPGFDSGIENHNRALTSYLGNGSCFVLVISLEKGTIDNPTLRFVHELSNYSESLIVLLNKRDKLTDGDAEEIQEAVKDSLEFDGISAGVYCISKYDEDISRRLVEIISDNFNAQYVFDRQVSRLVGAQLEEVRAVLEVLLAQNQDISLFSYDKELNKLKQTKQTIQEIFDRKKQEAEGDFPEKLEEIKSNLKSALINCADDVVKANRSGGAKAAEAVIVETIRPLLLQTFKDYTIGHIDGIVDEMKSQIDASKTSDKSSGTVSSLIVNTAETVKKMVENGTFRKSLPSEMEVNKEKKKKEDEKDKIYHAITGIASILTDVISPWMEVVIVLAPEIIHLAKKIFGESEESTARRIYIDSTVPQIMNQMHDSIVNAMKESNRLLMEYLEQDLHEKIAFLDSTIGKTQQQKTEKAETHQNYQAGLKKDISEIIRLENEVKGR